MTLYPFKYIKFPPFGREPKFRPMIRIRFLNTKASLPDFDALIDSGSDITLSYESFGRQLGIDFDDPKVRRKSEQQSGWPFEDQISGLAEAPIPVYVVPVHMLINGQESLISMRWLRMPFNPETDLPVILGQDSAFSLFDIHFSRRQMKFFFNDKVFTPE